MELYVGTIGYAYSAWKGRFYPRDIPAKRMLAYYGGRFRAVEINNSFYRMPTATVLEGWARDVPEDFRFALKASQRMTHVRRLKGADDTLAQFVEAAGVLKARLGPCAPATARLRRCRTGGLGGAAAAASVARGFRVLQARGRGQGAAHGGAFAGTLRDGASLRSTPLSCCCECAFQRRIRLVGEAFGHCGQFGRVSIQGQAHGLRQPFVDTRPVRPGFDSGPGSWPSPALRESPGRNRIRRPRWP